MNDQLGSIELQDMLRSRGIPAAIVVSVVPEGAIELEESQCGKKRHTEPDTHIVFNEPKLFSRDLCIGNEGSIMADQCLEFAAQGVTLNPVDHETTITGTSRNTTIGINEVEVVADILPALHQVIVRVATCQL
jgi:hypothetical protein